MKAAVVAMPTAPVMFCSLTVHSSEFKQKQPQNSITGLAPYTYIGFGSHAVTNCGVVPPKSERYKFMMAVEARMHRCNSVPEIGCTKVRALDGPESVF